MMRAVFTALIGDYEQLNELTVPPEPGVDRICLTDNRELVSASWQVVQIEAAFPQDPIRSQRLLKISGHPALAGYFETLYIDNTVKLLAPVSEILDSWLADSDIAIPTHCFRASIFDEFQEVLASRLDSRERFVEQLDHYSAHYPEALGLRPFWNGIIARRQSPAVDTLGKVWSQHVLRYSRRDQLSLTVAIDISGSAVRRMEINNYSSPIHVWPVFSHRNLETRFSPLPDCFSIAEDLRSDLEGKERELQRTSADLGRSEAALAQQSDSLQRMLASSSWKLTRPLRLLKAKFGSRG